MDNLNQPDLVDQIKARLSNHEHNSAIPVECEYKIAAVLIPLAFIDQAPVILFTKRSAHLKSHRGQISFPGGHLELSDQNLIDTALRETQEEIGIKPELVEILGSLKPVISPTGFYIFPYVGFLTDLEGLNKNIEEVEKIFCIPLQWLMDPQNVYQEDYHSSSGEVHKVWFFREYDEEKVWGITAGFMHQFIEILK